MRLVPIFADPKPGIYAVQFDEDRDEFRKIFDLWSDVAYLESFFEENKADLEKEFYGYITVEEAVELTLEEAEDLEETLYELAQAGQFDAANNLQLLLDPSTTRIINPLRCKKAKHMAIGEKAG